MERIVTRTHDTVFKYIFGMPENKDILLDLINAVVCPGEGEEKIHDVHLVDRELNPVQQEGKLCRVDLHAITSIGTHIDVEVQNVFEPYMDRRTLYYWADIFFRQLVQGDEYQKACPTYMIDIMNFNFFSGFPKYIRKFRITCEDTGEPLNGDLKFFFLELPKWAALKRKAQTSLERWLAFLSHGDPAEIEEYAMLDPAIRKALEAEKQFMADPEQMYKYEQYKKSLKDWNSSMLEAKKEGIKEGKELGIKEGQEKGIKEGIKEGWTEATITYVRNMLSMGCSVQFIHECTKLPISEIEALQQ